MEITPAELLDMPLPENDAAAGTVREYLIALLNELWTERDRFSGKRPFGNSGWEYDLIVPMIRNGIIRGTLDEDGYVESITDAEEASADRMIFAAIANSVKRAGVGNVRMFGIILVRKTFPDNSVHEAQATGIGDCTRSQMHDTLLEECAAKFPLTRGGVVSFFYCEPEYED